MLGKLLLNRKHALALSDLRLVVCRNVDPRQSSDFATPHHLPVCDPQVVPQSVRFIALEGAVRAVEQTHADVVQLLLDMLAQSYEARAAEGAVRAFEGPGTGVRAHVSLEVIDCMGRVRAVLTLVAEVQRSGVHAPFVSRQVPFSSGLEPAVVTQERVSSVGVSPHVFNQKSFRSKCACAPFKCAWKTHDARLMYLANMLLERLLAHERLRAVLARVVGREVDVLGMLGKNVLLLLLQ